MYLNDADIRPYLIDFLKSRTIKPRAIIEELHVHRGNAIADIVTVHNEAHCYEIKGDKDKISRILTQGEYYNKVFNRITLVTTESKQNEALIKSPNFWGILIVYKSNKEVKFRYLRKAKINQLFDKELALSTLWRSELTNLNNKFNFNISEKINKREFAIELAEKMNKFETNRSIANLLVTR